MDYAQAKAYLDKLEWFGMRLRLDVMEALLREFGDFHAALKVVHVGGTNGKGSVVALAASALAAAGHKTGQYTSPHLARFEERIQVDGRPISEAEVARGVEEIAPVVDEVSRAVAPVTYFEATTLLALRHFHHQRVDACVLEVGLGGRLDATNVIPDPLVTVITNVDLEHTQVLGDTVEAIAREKGAIVKPGVPFVTGAEGEALAELLRIADENVAPTRVLGRDFRAVRVARDDFRNQTVRFEGLRRDHGEVTLPLLGAHQLGNAALAAAALEEVDAQGVSVPVKAVQAGFANVRWPGRLQFVPGKPSILLDGAHNPAGVAALARFLEEEDLRPVALFGALSDKNWLEMVETLAPRLKAAVVTEPPSARKLEAKYPAREFARHGAVATVVPEVPFALATARTQAGPDGMVLVCGSLYLVGEALRLLGRPP
jgi:dihydrofolate synthase/folylpolyglutamate synthase